MKFSRLLLLSSVFVAVALSGCKKDDDDTSLYFNGTIRLPLESYVEAGYSKTFCVDTLINVSLQDGSKEGIGYAYKLPLATKRDTIKTASGDFKTKNFTVVAPDSLSTFSTVLYAFADGYYENSASSSFTVVSPGLNGKRTTLSGYDIKDTDKTFTDGRDGAEYYYSEQSGLQWMRQNLSWGGSGMTYDCCSSPAVGTIFGRYYTWNQAQTACPEGWRLPTEKEWVDLAASFGCEASEGSDIHGFAGKAMENIYFNRTRMWEYWRDVKIDNAAGLSAAPFGYAMVDEDSFQFAGFGKYAVFWTSSEDDGLGVYRYIFGEKDILFYGTSDKDYFAASVRCVREVPTL